MGNIIRFHPAGSQSTNLAFEAYAQADEDLALAMEAAVLELESSESFAETWIIEVDKNLWCIRLKSAGYWGLLFFTNHPNGLVTLLNGYVKKAKKIPFPSPGQVRRATYLMKELQYA